MKIFQPAKRSSLNLSLNRLYNNIHISDRPLSFFYHKLLRIHIVSVIGVWMRTGRHIHDLVINPIIVSRIPLPSVNFLTHFVRVTAHCYTILKFLDLLSTISLNFLSIFEFRPCYRSFIDLLFIICAAAVFDTHYCVFN